MYENRDDRNKTQLPKSHTLRLREPIAERKSSQKQIGRIQIGNVTEGIVQTSRLALMDSLSRSVSNNCRQKIIKR